MTSAFGIEHGVAKRDYTKAQTNWEHQRKISNRVENSGQSAVGGAGALLGGAALRDAAFKDHPNWEKAAAKKTAKLNPKLAEGLMRKKPGFKVLAVAAGGTVVGAVGSRHKKIAEKKVARYAVAKNEPGSIMHAHDIAKAMSDTELNHRKKAMAGTAIVGSTLGLAALGSKGVSSALPKLGKIGKTPRGQAYARKLDRAATNLAIGGAGVGGAGGFNFASVQNEEAKRKPLAKSDTKEKAKVGASAVVGGALGQSVYQTAGYGPKHYNLRRVEPKSTRSNRDKKLKPVKKTHGYYTPAMERNYPKSLPEWKTHRVLGYTHRGRTGTLVGAAATATGAATAAATATKRRKLSKAYDPEKTRVRRSRAAEGVAGATTVGAAVQAVRAKDGPKTRRLNAVRLEEHANKVREGRGLILRGMKATKQAEAEHSYQSNIKPAQRGAHARQAINTNKKASGLFAEGAKSAFEPKPKPASVRAAGKVRARYAAGAVAAGAVTAGIHARRNSKDYKPYKGRWS